LASEGKASVVEDSNGGSGFLSEGLVGVLDVLALSDQCNKLLLSIDIVCDVLFPGYLAKIGKSVFGENLGMEIDGCFECNLLDFDVVVVLDSSILRESDVDLSWSTALAG